MSTPQVASYGPVLSSGGGDLVNAGIKATTNAAPAAPAPATTAPIFAPGEEVQVKTTQVNEVVQVSLNLERANPGGNGAYQVTIDGVGAGPGRQSPVTVGPDGGTYIDALIAIALPGTHTIGANVTSIGAVETVSAGATLLVRANQFA